MFQIKMELCQSIEGDGYYWFTRSSNKIGALRQLSRSSSDIIVAKNGALFFR